MPIQLNNIRYKNILAVEQFHFQESQFYSINGPNGAGKSTLLNVLSGDVFFSGTVNIYSKNIKDWKKNTANKLARNMAILPQSSHISFDFTAKEIVEFGLIPLNIKKADANKLIKKVMLDCDCFHLAKQSILSLSGGERQRVHLARVLVQLSQAEMPPILLLDEPTSAQDLAQQHLILSLLKSLKHKGFTVIAVLHDLNHSIEYCDEVVVIANGKIVDHGSPKNTLKPDFIEGYWGYKPRLFEHYLL